MNINKFSISPGTSPTGVDLINDDFRNRGLVPILVEKQNGEILGVIFDTPWGNNSPQINFNADPASVFSSVQPIQVENLEQLQDEHNYGHFVPIEDILQGKPIIAENAHFAPVNVQQGEDGLTFKIVGDVHSPNHSYDSQDTPEGSWQIPAYLAGNKPEVARTNIPDSSGGGWSLFGEDHVEYLNPEEFAKLGGAVEHSALNFLVVNTETGRPPGTYQIVDEPTIDPVISDRKVTETEQRVIATPTQTTHTTATARPSNVQTMPIYGMANVPVTEAHQTTFDQQIASAIAELTSVRTTPGPIESLDGELPKKVIDELMDPDRTDTLGVPFRRVRVDDTIYTVEYLANGEVKLAVGYDPSTEEFASLSEEKQSHPALTMSYRPTLRPDQDGFAAELAENMAMLNQAAQGAGGNVNELPPGVTPMALADYNAFLDDASENPVVISQGDNPEPVNVTGRLPFQSVITTYSGNPQTFQRGDSREGLTTSAANLLDPEFVPGVYQQSATTNRGEQRARGAEGNIAPQTAAALEEMRNGKPYAELAADVQALVMQAFADAGIEIDPNMITSSNDNIQSLINQTFGNFLDEHKRGVEAMGVRPGEGGTPINRAPVGPSQPQ
jgi:hypothetical protein